MLQSTSISKSFFPLKDFIAYFYKWIFVILRGQPSSLARKERICHSMYNTPKSESAELEGKYLLSSWKCRTDAGIINRTLPTCSSCPGWSCMPLGLQVMLFILFRNKYAFGKSRNSVHSEDDIDLSFCFSFWYAGELILYQMLVHLKCLYLIRREPWKSPMELTINKCKNKMDSTSRDFYFKILLWWFWYTPLAENLSSK